MDHVAAAGDHEAALLLQPAHMLADQERRLQLLAQALVAERRDRGIAIRVLVPEVARLVAGPADMERVHERAQLAGGIDHQRHVVADFSAHAQQVFGFAPGVAVVPAVDLEAAVAELLAVLGEIGERRRAVEAAAALLAMVGAGIGRQALAKAAEQGCDRGAVLLAGEVPKRDVERPVAHVVVGAQLALQVVVDLLAGLRVAADQVRRQHDRLGERGGRADPVGDVFADQAVVGPDLDRVAARRQPAALDVLHIGDAGGAVARQAEVRHLVGKARDLDPVDLAHVPPPIPLGAAAH